MGDEHLEIQHFSHHHPLFFKEELEHNKNDRIGNPPVFCNGCEDEVSGPRYSCSQCPSNKLFILHKSCAELPREIHHPVHGKHLLVFLLTSTTGESREQNNIYCDACKQDCMGCFIYHCSQCDFNLDLKCASNWRNIMDSSHDHIFTILMKPHPHRLACDVCGEGGHRDKDGITALSFYLCNICQLLVHKKCCWLPSHAKIATHQHSLNLTWSFEDIYPKSDAKICQICLRNMDKSRAVYYCHEEAAGCNYVAHNTCAIRQFAETLRPKPPETTAAPASAPAPAPAPAPVTAPAPTVDEHITNKMQQLDEELPKTIQHFSHHHSLTLINSSDLYDDEDMVACDPSWSQMPAFMLVKKKKSVISFCTKLVLSYLHKRITQFTI